MITQFDKYRLFEDLGIGNTTTHHSRGKTPKYNTDYQETTIELDLMIEELMELDFDNDWIDNFLREMIIGKSVLFSCMDCPEDEFDTRHHRVIITSLTTDLNWSYSEVRVQFKNSDRESHAIEMGTAIIIRDFKLPYAEEIQKRKNQKKFDL